MQGGITFLKRSAWVIVLVALLSGALVQAQQLKAPNFRKNDFTLVQTWYDPSLLSIVWGNVEGAVASEIFIKGHGMMPKRDGGWRTARYASGVHHQMFTVLMPGKTYTFRFRYIDADGNKGKVSKPLKHTMLPCWVFNRFWKTHKTESNEWYSVVYYNDLAGDEHGPMPAEWKIKNTINCKGVNIRTKG